MDDVLKAVIAVDGAKVSFGAVRALDGVTLRVMPGECVGLVGHNGAGKSTIVSVINGGLTPHEGSVASDGERLERYGINAARARGVRCVFQELSLCPNLSIIENTRIMHRHLGGFGWRRRAAKIIETSLDAVFPGHGIDSSRAVGDLSIAERQMVEISMAFSDSGIAPRLVILDEPTSSLDASLARQMLDHVRRFIAEGGAVIFISHILHEILETADRIVVMKDGRVVAERPAHVFDHHGLVEAMGTVAKEETGQRSVRELSTAPVILSHQGKGSLSFAARKGEIIGLAGLAGHGQTELLLALHAAQSGNWLPERDPLVTFVAGDRRLNGVFELWSILRNFSIASLGDLSRRGLILAGEEETKGADWKRRIEIRTPDMDNRILSLSGGNQQKVLFARALATRAPIVLMDDPMRGVDVGTKQEVYAIIREEAARGRTFIWYSTEMDEVRLCDRVYVFREGRITTELAGDAVNETSIIAASFEGAAA
ncbi:sugar ABC transporter ATP-binding protein [Rhizobium leguminosarum]|uniref:sugar ABC transporter ATP-binding protein n=1 Tax=Rhizobium leguminosarum TaxID=384 RepID=UPI00143F393D|nr:sugar ABC transporter ATP-binding protein [Rhizobium leguminosarum]NKK62917.1 ATP-binding cassette domain-containing protein [Rhizobium leguminosarum bv. viciae]NKL03624.1 ATP-binding cassette domain-containing protein [Rhizobium leguminosarum bv. viciae]NKL83143.1 ATP-binding cassette domain-containing protein [Rhizobium leguminosarum bv. viciae]NKL88788.1 ATP-binding cassette domain-containing protein [Rhizobium leguminosarum bv. viciae]NKM90094.1 ATP-binding cassette domain-containing pr